jgi:DNA-binding MarR family transcriptional regulator
MVLQAVAELDASSQTDIVSATGIDRSSMADLVKRLVGYGWLRLRHTKGDAQSYVVSLTKEGQRARIGYASSSRNGKKSALFVVR